jgi:hypothetical protein
VAVDYFTKWVDAGALAKITAANVIKFFNGNVIARFGIPQLVVTENRSQFIDKMMHKLMQELPCLFRQSSYFFLLYRVVLNSKFISLRRLLVGFLVMVTRLTFGCMIDMVLILLTCSTSHSLNTIIWIPKSHISSQIIIGIFL